ncbi:hypothetical protein OPV22_007254 [Ensete ventricosum]|uniref:Uncharacterized protein n=1 Tax=Ensete ventricosum TaxID=4639 RepID=A0AAV8RU97_ENSVE|nr:hypothetical protein OPV22_007254 [Ensete ventricosum]
MASEPPEPEELPLACREITIGFSNEVKRPGKFLFELLSEALGLHPRPFGRDGMCERTCFSFELLSTMPRASLDSWNKQATISDS